MKNVYILLFLHRWVLGHEFILKKEIFKFERAMLAKLFDVKASLSSHNSHLKTKGLLKVI